MADSLASNARPGRHLFSDDHGGHVVPPKVASFGMWLFLIGLALLFASGMFAYVFIRLRGGGMPELGVLRPAMTDWKLFTSTAIVLAASVSIEMAVRQIRRERRGAFLKWLWVTSGLAVAFLLVQTPAMIDLLRRDPGAGSALVAATRDTRLYAMVFFFVLLHALHVIGGVIGLVVVVRKAARGGYDHEHYIGVRNTARYWHFLDLVWLLMFGTFLVLG